MGNDLEEYKSKHCREFEQYCLEVLNATYKKGILYSFFIPRFNSIHITTTELSTNSGSIAVQEAYRLFMEHHIPEVSSSFKKAVKRISI